MKKIFLIAVMLLNIQFMYGQAVAFTDPAKGYNKLLLDKTGNTPEFTRIGAYKVKGSPYFFGGGQKGIVYSKEMKYENVKINYNIFTQVIDIFSPDDKPLGSKKTNEIDSFKVFVETVDFTSDVMFYAPKLLHTSDKAFFTPLYDGTKYSVFKKYKVELGIVSDNILQSELRQFEIEPEYFYLSSADSTFKKIKMTTSGVIKEFKKIKDITPIVEEGSFIYNPENILKKVFITLNN